MNPVKYCLLLGFSVALSALTTSSIGHEKASTPKLSSQRAIVSVPYPHLTLPTTPSVSIPVSPSPQHKHPI